MVSEIKPQDNRGYFVLPQAPEGAGYYVYGTPPNGGGQYAHPSMMTALIRVERAWQSIDRRRFGVGNISLAGGTPFPGHSTHRSGLEVDLRPLRKDGAEVAVAWSHIAYDRESTAKLISLFRSYAPVELVYFNDTKIPGVTLFVNHDNHFHVKLRF